MRHLINGQLVTKEILNWQDVLNQEILLKGLEGPFDLEDLILAANEYSSFIVAHNDPSMLGFSVLSDEQTQVIQDIANWLKEENLRVKIKREFGIGHGFKSPSDLSKQDAQSEGMEAWYPLGVLLHVTPANSPGLGFLSVMEGLLSGNVNLLKESRNDNGFTLTLIRNFIEYSGLSWLKHMVHVLAFDSRDREQLSRICALCDGVAVWGGDAALESIKKAAGNSCRVIEWGPKISFSLIANEELQSEYVVKDLARVIARENQLTCSSPQLIFLESDRPDHCQKFSKDLLIALEEAESEFPISLPALQEQAEITNAVELCRLNSVDHPGLVLESKNYCARVLLEYKKGLEASPLFRTVRVRPVRPSDLIKDLRVSRHVLQTAGLACSKERFGWFSHQLFKAGVLRITAVSEMTDSYTGEPHDGMYALQRYSRRVSLRHPAQPRGLSMASAMDGGSYSTQGEGGLMQKTDFQSQPYAPQTELWFKSGGSSGEPAVSPFTWDEYHHQMECASEGLLAAGFEPRSELSANLFYGGGMYGGFLSFFTILEKLRARHLPIGADQDFSKVADLLLRFRVTTLLGMPGYLTELLRTQEKKLRFGHLKYIYYGGEPFTSPQIKWVKDVFGIRDIRSACYGSVDAGPIGYQCQYLFGREHHLHHHLHYMEILHPDKDRPAPPGTIGRIILTSRARGSIALNRYELGDMGRFTGRSCRCGRKSPVFELCGRSSDVFKAGGNFINYHMIHRILTEHAGMKGVLQIRLEQVHMRDRLICVLTSVGSGPEPGFYKEILLQHYRDLRDACEERLLELDVEIISYDQFIKTSGTMKLKNVTDLRI